VMFIPSCPCYIGLTGALNRSDRCKSLMGLWVLVLLFSSWSIWSCFVRFCVAFSFRAGCVLGVFLFQGLEKSLRLSETFVVRLL
jgi:hypothetical protein